MRIGIRKSFLPLLLIALAVWFWYDSLLKVKDGYTDKVSYFVGDTLQAYINVEKAKTRFIRLYDVKGREVDKINAILQPQSVSNDRAWQTGFNYKKTFSYCIPKKLKAGLYLWENKIPFIIKSKNAKAITIVYPSNTINAYVLSGGKNLYQSKIPNDSKVATQVSFLRPMPYEQVSYAQSFFVWACDYFSTEVNYICDMDLDNYDLLQNTSLLIIPGHSEYWTRVARLNFDRFIATGKNALVLSGNTMWWQVRYESSRNTMICYKKIKQDSIQDNLLKTINWNQPILQYPILSSIGADFSYGGYGKKEDNGWNGYKIIQANSPLLEGTGLQQEEILPLITVEYDGIPVVFPSNSSIPQIDTNKIKFYKAELIGFDKGFRLFETIGTFLAFQKTATSGVVINTGSTDWCNNFEGKNGENIRKITINAIQKLLTGKTIFVK